MSIETLSLPIKYFQIKEGLVVLYESPCTDVSFENINNNVIAQFQLNSKLHSELENIRINLINDDISNSDIIVTLVVDRELEKVMNGMEFIMSIINIKRQIEQGDINSINKNINTVEESEKDDNDPENENIEPEPILLKIKLKNGDLINLSLKNEKGPEIVNEIRDVVQNMRKYSERPKLVASSRSSFNYFQRSMAQFEVVVNGKQKRTSYSNRWIGPKVWHSNLEEIIIKCCIDIGLISKKPIDPNPEFYPIQISENIWEYTNWNLIDFEDNWVWYSMPDGKRYKFKNNKSRSVFQKIKRIFNLKGFKFRVKYYDGKPSSLDLDQLVFEYLDFGLMLRSLRNGNIVGKNLARQVTRFFENHNNKNKVHQLVAFLGYSKSFYFIYLSRLQIEEDNIKVLLEPTYNHVNDTTTGHEVSFIFQIKGNKWVYAVWESLSPGKATYVFRFKNVTDCSSGVLDFAHFLRSNLFQGRMALRQTGFGCELVNDIKYFFHSPNLDQQLEVGEDRSWENALYEYIK